MSERKPSDAGPSLSSTSARVTSSSSSSCSSSSDDEDDGQDEFYEAQEYNEQDTNVNGHSSHTHLHTHSHSTHTTQTPSSTHSTHLHTQSLSVTSQDSSSATEEKLRSLTVTDTSHATTLPTTSSPIVSASSSASETDHTTLPSTTVPSVSSSTPVPSSPLPAATDGPSAIGASSSTPAPPVRPPRPSFATTQALLMTHKTSPSTSNTTNNTNNNTESTTLSHVIHTTGTSTTSSGLTAPASNPTLPSSSPSSFTAESTEEQPFIIKNLDTGEICHLDEATVRFPEVAAASMTLQQFDEESKKKEEIHDHKINQEEIAEKKKSTGFLARMKQVLSGKDKKDEDDSHSNSKSLHMNSMKVKSKHRDYMDLSDVRLVQTLQHHQGPIWTVAISLDGQFVATGGQDSTVKVFAVKNTPAAKEHEDKLHAQMEEDKQNGNTTFKTDPSLDDTILPGCHDVLSPIPYRLFSGHKADVIDLAWSKANFLLSASIDKTVRLWHVTRQKCLCLFQHTDFVTSVAFHPIEDRYFISGSFDKKLRIWNIPEHRVVEWAQTANIITSANFSPNGSMAVAGLYNGQCVFYQSEGLKYHTQVDCKNRHGRNRKGKKVTGLQFSPDGKHLLVSTNDSRIRLYDMDDYSMIGKFKGLENDELQIKAFFSEDARYIISGSENQNVYVWSSAEYQQHINKNDNKSNSSTKNSSSSSSSTSNSSNSSGTASAPPTSKPDVKNDSYEYFRAFNDTCTSATFAPTSMIKWSSFLPTHSPTLQNNASNASTSNTIHVDANTIPSRSNTPSHQNIPATSGVETLSSSSTPQGNTSATPNSVSTTTSSSSPSTTTSASPTSTHADASQNPIQHLIIATGYQGELKIFENRGYRKSV